MEKSPSRKIKKKQVARIESLLLESIRVAGGLSRVELAREFELAPSTAGVYVNRLLDDGLLIEGELQGKELGRPRLLLMLNQHAGHFIGVDFEARNVQAVSVNFAQQELKRAHNGLNLDTDVDQLLVRLEETIEAVQDANCGPLLGIGVGVPGLVDPERGLAIRYSNLDKWHNLPLAEHLQRRFGVPVRIENNVRSMALAELSMGSGRKLSNFVLLAVRSGVGSAVVIDRQIYRGHGNVAGEIGLWQCPRYADGQPTGDLDLLQNLASVRAVGRAIAQKRGQTLKDDEDSDLPSQIVDAYLAGDKDTVSALQDSIRSLSWTISQLAYVLGPEKVILCGPFTELGEHLLRPLQEQVQDLPFLPAGSVPQILAGEFREYQGAIGAAAAAISHWQPNY